MEQSLMGHSENDIDKKIFKLRSYYVQKLPEKILQLEMELELLRKNIKFTEHLKEVRLALHTLYGTAGTYGFQELGDVIKACHRAIVEKLDEDDTFSAELISVLEENITISINTILALYDSYDIEEGDNLNHNILSSELDYSSVLYVTKMTQNHNEEFVSYIKERGLKIDVVETEIESLISYFQKKLPVVVFIDMDDTLENHNLFMKIKDLRDSYLQAIHFIYLSTEYSIKTRVQALRMGADAFYSFPSEEAEVTDYIDYNILYHDDSKPRIIILNDSERKANGYSYILQASGMETHIVDNPFEISRHLIEFEPDLIIMEMYMEMCNGIDLARVLKQQTAYSSLPIIFTSDKGGTERKLLAIENGGDDYFQEPIDPAYLIQSVHIRVQRMKVIQSRLDKDGLTKLYNHKKAKELLEIEFLRTHRYGKNFVFAMLDIDHFKEVNDTYGHMVGDTVLRKLSSVLTKRFRKTDIVGRYGGEEFSVILMETSLYFAEIVFNKLREEFEKIVHSAGSESFCVTFSCGLASAEDFDSADEVNKAADDALYRAKEKGRNRIEIYQEIDDENLFSKKD